MSDRQLVGIGELLVAGEGQGVLAAHGLGSCIALVAWDPVGKVGGMAHFMLPTGTRPGGPAKYVDSGIPAFLQALGTAGARAARLRLKAAGGAAMLSGAGASMEVGRRNIAALHATLTTTGMSLAAHDLGGTRGRSVELDLSNGQLIIKTISGVSAL